MTNQQEAKIRIGLEMLEEYIQGNMEDDFIKDSSVDPHQKIGFYIGTLDNVLIRIKNIRENV